MIRKLHLFSEQLNILTLPQLKKNVFLEKHSDQIEIYLPPLLHSQMSSHIPHLISPLLPTHSQPTAIWPLPTTTLSDLLCLEQ